MKLQIYNAKEEDLQNHSVFIGISVGIKPMSEEIALSYLRWADKHTSRPVHILIADEIAKYNYLACSHSTKPGALSRAIRDGDQYQVFFEKIIEQLKETKNRFQILRWKDIRNERFHSILHEVEMEFRKNPEFREQIIFVAEKYLERRQKWICSEKKSFVYQYLLEELPTLLDGIYVDEVKHDLLLYPTYKHSGMSSLVSDIQNGLRFKNFGRRLKLEKTVLVEWLITNVTQLDPL